MFPRVFFAACALFERFSGVQLASCVTSKAPLIRPVGHLLPNGEGKFLAYYPGKKVVECRDKAGL